MKNGGLSKGDLYVLNTKRYAYIRNLTFEIFILFYFTHKKNDFEWDLSIAYGAKRDNKCEMLCSMQILLKKLPRHIHYVAFKFGEDIYG